MDSFIIIGGDKRQRVLAQHLLSGAFETYHLKEKESIKSIEGYSCVVLPLPLSKDGIDIYSDDSQHKIKLWDVVDAIKPYQKVFAFGLNDEVKTALSERKVDYYDFLCDDDFALSNAYLTAQGCLRLLLESTQDYIPGSKALIIGFGKVALALSCFLKGLCVDVYIAARSTKQLQKAKYLGYKTINLNLLEKSVCYFDFIFGTVPKNLLTPSCIKLLKDDCIYFELASAPYTANKEDFLSLNKKYVFGGSLPGRYLPDASGRLLYECIMQQTLRQKE